VPLRSPGARVGCVVGGVGWRRGGGGGAGVHINQPKALVAYYY
jgi:hypothetical protein